MFTGSKAARLSTGVIRTASIKLNVGMWGDLIIANFPNTFLDQLQHGMLTMHLRFWKGIGAHMYCTYSNLFVVITPSISVYPVQKAMYGFAR